MTMRKVAVVGAGMTRFVRRAQETPKELSWQAVRMALQSCEMTMDDIEGVCMGTAPDSFDGIHFNGEYLSDGAGAWRKFYSVTIPMVSPAIFFNLVMGLIGTLQYFTNAYVMTSGGPNNATLFYALYLYRNAFEYLRMGYGSALAWVLFVITMALTSLVFKSSPLWVFYEYTTERTRRRVR